MEPNPLAAITNVLFADAEGGRSSENQGAQDKKLGNGEIKRLQDADIDIHDPKGGKNASKYDLYKNRDGDILVKPKGGRGSGDPTGLNINDFK